MDSTARPAVPTGDDRPEIEVWVDWQLCAEAVADPVLAAGSQPTEGGLLYGA